MTQQQILQRTSYTRAEDLDLRSPSGHPLPF